MVDDDVLEANGSSGQQVLRIALMMGLGLVDAGLLLRSLTVPGATSTFGGYLGLRALLALVTASIVALTDRRGRRSDSDDKWFAFAVAAWCFALPLFGGVIACIVLWPRSVRTAPATLGTWQLWPLPVRWDNPALKIAPPTRRDEPVEVAGDLLLFSPANDGRRLHALLRAARLPLRFQVPLARGALGDSNDDVRLFAFSLIDRRRRDHERALQTGRATLEQAPTPASRALGHLRMAELAWEAAYHGLAEGSGLTETLKTALDHIDRSLAISPNDSSAHALRGRILLRLGEPETAEGAFRRALDLRLPALKVLPHLAECAFHRRRFGEVRQYLVALSHLEAIDGPMPGRLRAVMEHWL